MQSSGRSSIPSRDGDRYNAGVPYGYYNVASLYCGDTKFSDVQRYLQLFERWSCCHLYSTPLAATEAGQLAHSSALSCLEKLGASTSHNHQPTHYNPYRSHQSASKPCLPISRCGNFSRAPGPREWRIRRWRTTTGFHQTAPLPRP